MRKEPLKVNILFILSTLFLKSRSGDLSNVFYKTTLITGGMGRTGACSPTCKMGTFLKIPWHKLFQLATISNFMRNS